MNIHQRAVLALGKVARLNHLRKEAIELAHEIDRYLDGKSNAEQVVGEAHDVAYLTKSLAHIEGFEDYCRPSYQYHLDIKSESRLKEALRDAARGGEQRAFIDVSPGTDAYLAEIPVMLDGDRYIIGLTDYTPDDPAVTWGDPDAVHPCVPAVYAYDLMTEDGMLYLRPYGERWAHAIKRAIDKHMATVAIDKRPG